MKTQLSIKKFTDYRSFLVAHAQDMKSSRKSWSYGAWAQNMGLKATSSLTKILNGEREPGSQITEQFVSYFNFDSSHAQYFRDLVKLQKIKHDPRLAVLLMQKMGKEHPNAQVRIMGDKSFLVISNWYYLALRELCRTRAFKEDPEWVVNNFNFKITARDVSAAIKTMLSLGLLKRNSRGRLELAEGRIDTTNDISSEAIKRYHEQMLENAKLALRKFSVHEREFSSTSLVMSSANILKAKELIREFKFNFEKLLEEDSGDQVFQLQIQLFPLTKSNKRSCL